MGKNPADQVENPAVQKFLLCREIDGHRFRLSCCEITNVASTRPSDDRRESVKGLQLPNYRQAVFDSQFLLS